MGPILSSDQHSAMAPLRETRPNVGRKPVAPQREQGATIEPSVSLPIANPTRPAAVAAAEPALEPREPSCVFHGLRVCPPYQMSPYASAPTLVLPSSTAPAASRRATTRALVSGTRWANGSAPQPVVIPAVSSRSFAP